MKIERIDKLTSERWVNLFAAGYEHNGHTGRWVFASRKERPHADGSADAVLMVPILRNPGEPPRLVLIREFRVPVGDYVLGFPAGLIDPGETVEGTIHREIREETGLRVTRIKRVTQPLFSSAGVTDEAVVMAFLDVEGDEHCKPHLEASEDLEVVLLDFEGVCRTAREMNLHVDIKVWSVLYHYEMLGKLD